MSDIRHPAVAGRFYTADPVELREQLSGMLAGVSAAPTKAVGGIVPHAGLVYSGECAAQVFGRIEIPAIVVILAPNHTGRWEHSGGAAAWDKGRWETPLGDLEVAGDFLSRVEAECGLVRHDPAAHLSEHAVEVELPFLKLLAPDVQIAPIVLAWDDWDRCRSLATALATVVSRSADAVLLLASSDMTHFESSKVARQRDRSALDAVEALDGEQLLATCQKENVTMCGRAPSATVVEAARQLGATRADLVDYRHSGLVTGDDSNVVAYAGVVIRA